MKTARPKTRTDWLTQQQRIRSEYALRLAVEAYERTQAEWQRLQSAPLPVGYTTIDWTHDNRRIPSAGTGQKH